MLIVPTPETRQFWDATRDCRLLLQRCGSCGHVYFPPRPFCPHCWSRDVQAFDSAGLATLYSYVISHRSGGAGFTAPFSIALVTLQEGPRLVSNIVDCPQTPEALVIDMPLELAFRPVNDGYRLPVFRPRGAQGAP